MTLTEINGGLQIVPQITEQVIYLDFDGALTSYNGEILSVDNVNVQDSRLDANRIAAVVAELNAKYSDQKVTFVTERPAGTEYSTIYIGKTDAFSPYGSFAGLAETVDSGNKNKSDNAFVMLDAGASNAQIISTIAHETDHLLGTLDHGGEGLAQYACSSHGAVLTGPWNGNNGLWYIGLWAKADHGFSSCNYSRCVTTAYSFDNISSATLTNGTYDILPGYYISSTTIGAGAHVTLPYPEGSNGVRYYPYADEITITSGGVLDVVVHSATNITLHSSGTVGYGQTGSSLTHHGNSAAYLSDIDEYGQVFGKVENFDFNGRLYANGAKLYNVTVGRKPDPYGGYYWGYLHLNNNAVASNTTVLGRMHVSSGTSAVNTTVAETGYLFVSNGASIDTLTMTGGVTSIGAETVVTGETVISGGELHILGGTFSTPLTVADSGVVLASSNAVISGAQVRDGGLLQGVYVHTTKDIVVLSGGTQVVNYVAQADNTVVSSGGSMLLYGVGNNTVVDGGIITVESNAVDNDTVLKNNAEQYLLRDAVANRTQISSGAVQSLGIWASAFDGTVFSGGSQVLHGAYAIADRTIVHGVQSVLSKATVSNTSVYGSQYVGSSGSAINTHINSGVLTAVSGAYLNNLYVSHGGTAILESGVNAISGVILSGGVVSNGYFANLVISSGGLLQNGEPVGYYGGYLELQAGASATGVVLDKSDKLNVVVASDTLLLATDYNGNAYNISNGLFADWQIASSNTFEIAEGAVASNTTIASNGKLIIRGKGENITNYYYGSLIVESGGYASGGKNSGSIHIKNGGVAEAIRNNYIYGWIYVSSGGCVSNTTVNDGGVIISAFGTASDTLITSANKIYVESDGKALNTLIDSGATLVVSSGGTATVMFNPWIGVVSSGTDADVTYLDRDAGVYIGSRVFVSKTNTLSNTIVSSGWDIRVYDDAEVSGNTVESGGKIIVSGGVVNDTLLNGGWMFISRSGAASNTILSGGPGYYDSAAMCIFSGGVANSTTLNYWGYMFIESGGVANSTTVNSGGRVNISSGGTHRGSLQIESGATVSAYYGATIDFTLSDRKESDGYLINDFTRISGRNYATYTITVSADQASGSYKLVQNVSSFTKNISIGDGSDNYGTLTVNGSVLEYNDASYTLVLSDGNLTLTVERAATEPVLTGDKNGVEFTNISGNAKVEFSKNNFVNVLQVTPSTNAVDTYGMSSGTYQWQVCAEGTCYQGNNIVSDNTVTPQKFISDADGDMDVFFANANGVWETGYAAEHQGSGNWQGTKEQIVLDGKNKIADVFTGSSDANVLVLTDDANGDALFVDDIYTQFGSDAARLAQIDEIRAGAGDDIVDLTSQQFTYIGNGVKIYGGAGNDTIWANSGNNTLFGDAGNDCLVGADGDDIIIGGIGNDSMHGGGGNDTFCFGANWGNDTVEQLAGQVTLYFESGSEANWNVETLTYTDGVNSVKVSGVTNADVTLVFGEPAPVAGAFLDAASENIFEDKNKGMIA